MLLAAEQAPSTELINQNQLLKRPPERGLAIDPDNPFEIDDAIWVEPFRSKRGFSRVQVHVADAGLLYGQDDLIKYARERGWSEYHDDDTPELMLPSHIALYGLSLNIPHANTGYAPALTIEFTFDRIRRRISDQKMFKSRVTVETTNYEEFE